MKLRSAAVVACTGLLVLALTTINTFATIDPIPGVDIIVRKNPGSTRIKVGDCRAGGGKIVKMGSEWVCTGHRVNVNDQKSGDSKRKKYELKECLISSCKK